VDLPALGDRRTMGGPLKAGLAPGLARPAARDAAKARGGRFYPVPLVGGLRIFPIPLGARLRVGTPVEARPSRALRHRPARWGRLQDGADRYDRAGGVCRVALR